jgi:hypothetical protein
MKKRKNKRSKKKKKRGGRKKEEENEFPLDSNPRSATATTPSVLCTAN